jgi:chromosome segregation ATPase
LREYVAENKGTAEKTLIIEHPRQPGWTLVEPKKPIETTDALYRFKGKIAAGEKSSVKVKEEIVTDEGIAILPCDINQLIEYTKNGSIPQEVKDALSKAIQYRQALMDFERQIKEQDEKLKQITEQQQRIRENMKTVDKSSQYYNRLLGKLNDQESQIEKLQTDRDSLMQKRDDQRKQLEDYLKDLSIG